MFDATNFGDAVTVNASAIDNDFVVGESLELRVDFTIVSLDVGFVRVAPLFMSTSTFLWSLYSAGTSSSADGVMHVSVGPR